MKRCLNPSISPCLQWLLVTLLGFTGVGCTGEGVPSQISDIEPRKKILKQEKIRIALVMKSLALVPVSDELVAASTMLVISIVAVALVAGGT